MDTEYLFVYGTLRRRAGHPMHRLLRHHARYLGEGQVQGRLHDLGGYPGLVLDPRAPAVEGEIYAIANPRPLFRQLDDYEGCSPRHRRPHEYRRILAPVEGPDGTPLQAWLYEYDPRSKRRR